MARHSGNVILSYPKPGTAQAAAAGRIRAAIRATESRRLASPRSAAIVPPIHRNSPMKSQLSTSTLAALAIALAVGCGAGSYLASHWGVKKGAGAIRRIVVVIAVLCLLDQLRHIVLALI